MKSKLHKPSLLGSPCIAVAISSTLLFGSFSAWAESSIYYPYVPSKMITRQLSEADAFGEAMSKGRSEGILKGAMATQMQSTLNVSTPIRMKVVKGELTAKQCQVMYTSMAVQGIKAPLMSANGWYIFTNKLTLCKDGTQPISEVVACDFDGTSCLELPALAPK